MSKDNVLRWLRSLDKGRWYNVPGHEHILVFVNETVISKTCYVRYEERYITDDENNVAEYISEILIKRALDEIIEEV